ncbi:MAG: sigma-54-dependent Fis family transcriptional regulator [Deltaproteobacteria bacterium]|uniref:sigma-54-dependent transcriptional regulator n=1 Tax=Hydrosulfovibrio ferrireducens TaxID=2934181 RepID=UPI001228D943|nr:MAG: sigma-54-dependent Fis family transcriptional regulator [Deltaproteobacteria bacterium]
MAETAKILVVDDEPSMREFLVILLNKNGYGAHAAASGAEALTLLRQRHFDLIVSDIRMPDLSGLGLLENVKQQDLSIPVVLITAYASPEDAVLAMKNGAYDYITKPFKVDDILSVIKAALGSRQEKPPVKDRDSFAGIIGNSPEMLKIYDLIQRIGPTQANVLIYGESGTGKELVAQAIHQHSNVAANAFVPITCSAIPENLIESELFGHAKGSFTGAIANKTGLFELANNGSAFLDEIGELSPLIQTKLLRVLQEREFKKVGGTETIKVKVRIISATNKNLEEEVMAGRFREDLFYRLAVVPIRMPPLRERKGDVPLLVDHFLKKYSALFGKEVQQISSYALKVLMDYDFPGNVRELENIVERGVALESSNIILPESLTLSGHRLGRSPGAATLGEKASEAAEESAFDLGLEQYITEIEKRLIQTALARTGNSRMKAADLLKMSFRSFRYKAKKYNI